MRGKIRKTTLILLLAAAVGSFACTHNPERDDSAGGDEMSDTPVGDVEEREGGIGTYSDTSYSGDTSSGATEARTGSSSTSKSQSKAQSQKKVETTASADIDLSKYPYEKRSEFRDVMGGLLENLDKGIASLTTSSPKAVPESKKLNDQQDQLTARLGEIDSMESESWEQFKTTFRDDVRSLESQYNSVAGGR